MTKPDDVSQEAWERAKVVLDGYLYSKFSPEEAIARAIDAAKAEQRETDAKACIDFPYEHQFVGERYAEVIRSGRVYPRPSSLIRK